MDAWTVREVVEHFPQLAEVEDLLPKVFAVYRADEELPEWLRKPEEFVYESPSWRLRQYLSVWTIRDKLDGVHVGTVKLRMDETANVEVEHIEGEDILSFVPLMVFSRVELGDSTLSMLIEEEVAIVLPAE